jgi:hypothetical protein
MGIAPPSVAASRPVSTESTSASPRVPVDSWGLQIGLVWVMTSLLWCFFGPEPETVTAQTMRLVALDTGLFLTTACWLAGSNWSFGAKFTIAALLLTAAAWGGFNVIQDFDAIGRIYAPAELHDGRVVHRGLRLSYELPTNFVPDLEPMLTLSRKRRSFREQTTTRLLAGEVAVLCRMIDSAPYAKSGHKPATIVLEVQMVPTPNLNGLILNVARSEEYAAAYPGVTITKHLHVEKRAGCDTVEFEFDRAPEIQHSRQVYLRGAGYVLHFLVNSEDPADASVLDDFLNSIRWRP